MDANPIQQAMTILGGRPEDVAVVCRVSAQTVYNWLAVGYCQQARHAVLLSEATMARGHGISVRTLAGMDLPTAPPSNPVPRRRTAQRGKRAFQKEARVRVVARAITPSSGAATLLVQPVHGRVPAVRQVRPVQPQRQVHAGVAQAAGHVLQRLTAA